MFGQYLKKCIVMYFRPCYEKNVLCDFVKEKPTKIDIS